jgi:hypothetical protein
VLALLSSTLHDETRYDVKRYDEDERRIQNIVESILRSESVLRGNGRAALMGKGMGIGRASNSRVIY